MTIRLIVTGGTLDKRYNELNGELYFPKSHVPLMLDQARCTLPIVVEEVMLKDSLEMTDEDRETVKRACLKAEERRLLITHGTDTMVETARHIAAAAMDKTVVLLGAMIPYTFGNSDALFNLGCAVSAVQTLRPGVYITMNGRVFDWDNVRKVREHGRFHYL